MADKERNLIKMQRHLRPLTAAPKKSRSTNNTKSGDARPVTASVARSRSTFTKQILQKSHLHVSCKTAEKDSASKVETSLDITPIEPIPEEDDLIDIVDHSNQANADLGESL